MIPDEKRTIIDQAQQQRMVRDTLILQKVNAAHREAFKEKFPGQIEHCTRLAAERLHHMLLKKPEDLSNPATWVSTSKEILDMAHTVHLLVDISSKINADKE